MIKKVFTYTDFLGNERTEECRFGLSKTDITRFDADHNGTLKELLERATTTVDPVVLYNIFSELVLASYGELSLDGRVFRKNKEKTEDFKYTMMFDMLMDELMHDSEKCIAFVNGIMPEVEAAPGKVTKPVLANVNN